ncbi:unnamed protein product [Paramecium primaurelia]|uniref:Uncharacterized protein n=1 Tax=Paramecium primaurelia TaxID=5886 RepID=A0A8S1QRK3_PARPR|nr:unnamed protein product [Paramecium primaurelia]
MFVYAQQFRQQKIAFQTLNVNGIVQLQSVKQQQLKQLQQDSYQSFVLIQKLVQSNRVVYFLKINVQ